MLTIDNQLQVWSWCLGRQAELGRRITSPFRPDKTPGCILSEHQGTVFFFDGAGKEGHAYTCEHAVAYLSNKYKDGKLNLNWARNFIAYNLTFGKNPIISVQPVSTGFKRTSTIGDVFVGFYPNGGYGNPQWTQKDIEYWSKRGIGSEQLEAKSRGGRVYSVHTYIINKSTFEPVQPCFAYTVMNKVKIYQPYAPKEYKWFSSVTPDEYWHTQRGCKKLFISKAQKDHLEAENLFIDYDILSGMNESTMPSKLPEILDCYDEAVAVFDEDSTGLKTLTKLRDLGVRTFVVDVQGCKDIDDVIVNNKILKFKEIK